MRYVDDLVVLGDDESELWTLRTGSTISSPASGWRCTRTRRTSTAAAADSIEWLGYCVFPHHRRLRRDNGYRFRRRLRAKAVDYALGNLELAEVRASVQAWIGHVRHADSEGLRRAVLGSVCFTRATDRALRPARGPGRRLEQPENVRSANRNRTPR
ncbi:MAG: hypothetical protein U5O69_01295 [Candidatus Competibacteraceae bacterium]|nr:hypothetical protein [Candidatus Competibacteraceae bacterium]